MIYQAQGVGLVLILGMLSACGNAPGERALTGGGLGAGVGAAGAAITGGDMATGALLGGAAGAATGYFTKKKDINLGDSPF